MYDKRRLMRKYTIKGDLIKDIARVDDDTENKFSVTK